MGTCVCDHFYLERASQSRQRSKDAPSPSYQTRYAAGLQPCLHVYRVEIRVGGGRKGATWKLVLKLTRWDYLNILLISSPKTTETWDSQ